MGRVIKIDVKGFEELRTQITNLQKNIDEIMGYLTKDIAALLLRKVTKRTPVGNYDHVLPEYKKNAGDLRRNWTVGEITRNGNVYNIEVINPTEYASYVEFGHMQEPGRFVPALGKKLKKAWVPGRFMLTISENEIKNDLENILSHRLKRALKRVYGND